MRAAQKALEAAQVIGFDCWACCIARVVVLGMLYVKLRGEMGAMFGWWEVVVVVVQKALEGAQMELVAVLLAPTPLLTSTSQAGLWVASLHLHKHISICTKPNAPSQHEVLQRRHPDRCQESRVNSSEQNRGMSHQLTILCCVLLPAARGGGTDAAC